MSRISNLQYIVQPDTTGVLFSLNYITVEILVQRLSHGNKNFCHGIKKLSWKYKILSWNKKIFMEIKNLPKKMLAGTN